MTDDDPTWLKRARRWGPKVVAVPGNVQMAIDVWGDQDATAGMRTAVLVRLPLQLPMIWAVLQGGPESEAVSSR